MLRARPPSYDHYKGYCSPDDANRRGVSAGSARHPNLKFTGLTQNVGQLDKALILIKGFSVKLLLGLITYKFCVNPAVCISPKLAR